MNILHNPSNHSKYFFLADTSFHSPPSQRFIHTTHPLPSYSYWLCSCHSLLLGPSGAKKKRLPKSTPTVQISAHSTFQDISSRDGLDVTNQAEEARNLNMPPRRAVSIFTHGIISAWQIKPSPLRSQRATGYPKPEGTHKDH